MGSMEDDNTNLHRGMGYKRATKKRVSKEEIAPLFSAH